MTYWPVYYLLPIVKNTKKIRWVTRTFEILLNAASIVAGLDESWLVPLRLKITYLKITYL